MIATQTHDPGGKTHLSLPLWVTGSAIFGGPNDIYRYELARVWDDALPAVLFVGMNPSVGSPNFDDPTLYKERLFAVDWGFGTLIKGNAFGYRVTDQKRLLEVSDPVGPDNDMHLLSMANRADMILFAYGQPHKSLRYRGPEVARMIADKHLKKCHVLELSMDGTPKHPLYLNPLLQPTPWDPRV